MKTLCRILGMLVLLSAVPLSAAQAQFLSPLNEGETAFYLNYAEEPVLAWYAGFATGDEGEVMHVTDLQIPVKPEEQDWRLKLGGQANLIGGIRDGWDLSPAVSVLIRYREGGHLTWGNLGMDFTILTGYYAAYGFLIGEYGFNKFTRYFSGARVGASVAGVEINLRMGKHHKEPGGSDAGETFLSGGINFRF